MREGAFIGVTVEKKGADIPASRFESFSPQEQKAVRVMETMADLSSVPDEVLQESAANVVQGTQEIKEEAEQQSRETLLQWIRRYPSTGWGKVAVVGTLISIARLSHDVSEEVRTHIEDRRVEQDAKAFMKDLPSMEDMRADLENFYGKEIVKSQIPLHVSQADHHDQVERQHGSPGAHANSGDRAMHVDDAKKETERDLKDFVHTFLPRQWTQSSVIETFSVASKPIPMSKEYGIEGEAAGVCHSGSGALPAKIEFAPGTSAEQSGIVRLTAHEAAHANDWVRSNSLSSQERLTLLYAVTRRVASKSRAEFSYVEAIKNDSAQVALLSKATEYWAEVMATALSTDTKTEKDWEHDFLVRLSGTPQTQDAAYEAAKKDLAIVRWYFKTAAPDFKPWEATPLRREFQTGYVMGAVESALEQIPPGDAKALLMAPGRVVFYGGVVNDLPPEVEAAWDIMDNLRSEIESIQHPSASDPVLNDRKLKALAGELAMVLSRLTPYEKARLKDQMEENVHAVASISTDDDAL